MSRARSGNKRVETRAMALTRRQRRRQSGGPARELPAIKISSVAEARMPVERVEAKSPRDTATRRVSRQMAALAPGELVEARAGEDAREVQGAVVNGEWMPQTAEEESEAREATEWRTAEREATTPRPGAATSSYKHPTLALMAEIAARGGTTGPLVTPTPPRASIPDADEPRHRAEVPPAEAAESAASAEAETPVRRVLNAETHPMRAVRRAPADTERDMERSRGGTLLDAPGASASLAAQRGHHPFPAPDLVLVTTGGHAAVAAVAAVIGAILTLNGAQAALTLLAFAALAGCSGGLAYLLAQQPETRRAAGLTLICAQVGMLAWVMAMIGPHAALLVLVPALAVLAARMVSWRAAAGQTVAVLGAYLLFLWMQVSLGVTPLLAPREVRTEALDAVVAVAGVLIAVAALHNLTTGRERALALARAREHEARTLRAALARERQRTDEDADALHQALSAGVRRRPSAPVRAEGSLGLLAMSVNRALERLAVLHEDREERRRLEGALGQLTRALERSWLGLPWAWPETSGTPVDAVVSLLRAPRPRDVPAATWPDDAPTLISLPTLGQLSEPGTMPGQTTPATSGSGWVTRRRTSRLAEVAPPETGLSSPRWNIHEAEEDGER